ncbi:MAG TPA: hypothetical protein VGA58_13695 [bacterium]
MKGWLRWVRTLLRSQAGILTTSSQAPPFQFARGRVDTTGPTKISGSDFTVAKLGVGDVRLTFATPFNDVPGAVAMGEGANIILMVQPEAPTTTTVRFVRNHINVGNEDGILDFIAFG